ncbi:hypothetical protein Q8A67_018126 [Cirrhinus molitorella]|uniref:Uncharacterized protein n=1 Tax=Cirrhinus molitorella TaxID=172907 RepID=A0AA88TH33_9TELE|nr:hypothetical protein Q8A67_018126 [Cirrhinus molitorella]
MEIQVQSHAEEPKVSWSLSIPWIFFTLSVVLNVIFASCLTVILWAVSTENNISISNISIPALRNINASIECVSENLIGTTKMEIQVHNRVEKPKESWSLSTPWIFFTLSVVLNVIFASCLTVILWKREKPTKPKDKDHVYMTAMKREESVYETIKMSSERS